MIVEWQDGQPRLENFLQGKDGYAIAEVIEDLLGYERYDVDAEAYPRLISSAISGDIVVDGAATRSQLLSGLEELIEQEKRVRVSLREAETEHPVMVLKGAWHFQALPDEFSPRQKDGAEVVEVFGTHLDGTSHGSASVFEDDAERLSFTLSRFFEQKIVVEATGMPVKVRYHPNYFGDGTPVDAKAAHDVDLALAHFCEQTGLTRSTENRREKRLEIGPRKAEEQNLP